MLHIIAVTDSHSHFRESIGEYTSRLKGDAELKHIKPESSRDPVVIRRKESTRIREYLEKTKGFVIYCDVIGEPISTEQLSGLIERLKNSHPHIIFLIAGAYGIDETILGPHINHRISFSPMTFPHSLALLILLEQLYRTEQIRKNTGYHH
ncbi:MAG: 23S rRNA (pseudouridine(1915)-N(3))-methyltransferase RlmH [Candidatus Gracilibacteria bacterium]|nr:23S rRNA (pseudouridine(1915)-N(3))-methyltransferase RlmH [Candidatus Gracilibacteria bacterium]